MKGLRDYRLGGDDFEKKMSDVEIHAEGENLEPEKSRIMVIENVFSIAGRGTVITGQIENGTVSINETVIVNSLSFMVTGIEYSNKRVNSASSGMNVGIFLKDATKEDCRNGDIVYKENAQSVFSSDAPMSPDDIARELLEAGYQNKRLEAIKILRQRCGLGLKAAKDVVDRVFDGNGTNVSNNKSGGCYVATCVYGSYDCPQVWTLRRYRDNVLASTWYGRAFIRMYYAVSPTIVKWFGHTAWFKKLWQGKLDRMVCKLQAEGVENTPYEDKVW